MMLMKTFFVFLNVSVLYFVIADCYVVVVNFPKPSDSVKEQINDKARTLVENATSDIIITNWFKRNTPSDDEAECSKDKGYSFYNKTQSCYKVHTDRATWNDAEMTCVLEGGHLAVINSQDEADILTTLYPKGDMHVFVGFSYREQGSANISDMYKTRKDGVWLTIDGQTLSEAGYESWTPGEPNNAGGKEYCGTIYGNGKFDDSACFEKFHYICEIKRNVL